jgi:hypothetical protein
MRYWLARLTFTFLILAGFLGWNAYKGATGQIVMSQGQIVLYTAGAFASFLLFLTSLRERHRPQDDDQELRH